MRKFASALFRAALTGRPDSVIVKTADSPTAVADILREAAREMGAQVYRASRGAQEDTAVALYGRESGGIWAVQIRIRGTRRGSSVELTALGEGMECSDTYHASVERRDMLASRLQS